MISPDGQTPSGITICIPTFNRASLLARMLQSVARISLPGGLPVEVLVIDNNCTDNTAETVALAAVQSLVPLRRVSELRPGLCHARNRALAEAAREHVAFFDDDVDVSAVWIAAYMEAAERLGADCVVGPVTPAFEVEPPSWLTPAVLDSVTSSYSRKGEVMIVVPPERAHEVPGCNFGVRRSVALELGGFEVDLDRKGRGLLSGGDWEFGARLVRAGRRVVYHPGCAVTHVISAGKISRRGLRRRWFGFGRTEVRLMEKRGAPLGVARRVRIGLRSLRFGLTAVKCGMQGQPGPAFQKELEALRALGMLCG